MWRTTLRTLLSHKLRLALSGLSIVLGVAFVVGTLVFTDTLSRTFRDLFEVTVADVNVVAEQAFDVGTSNPGVSAPATVPESLVADLSGVPGIAAVDGFVQSEGVYVLDPSGEIVDTGGSPGVGAAWDVQPELNPSTLLAGRAPEREGEVALDRETVDKTGYALGDEVTVLTTGPRVQARLVGVVQFGDGGGLAGASLTLFDLDTAQRLIGEPGRFDGLSIAAADGVTDAELAERVRERLGDGFAVTTAAQEADGLTATLEEELSFFSVLLLVFAGIALFVGSFIILNTFSMLVAQRSRELALLRALGAGRSQVTRSVLVEALVLGAAGSTVGVLAGLVVAVGLRALFATFGLTLDGSLVLTSRTVVLAYVVGVLVTLVSAWLPARRASRVAPVAAMHEVAPVPEHSLRRRGLVGAGLAVAGVLSLVVAETEQGTTAASWVGVAAVALLVAAVVLGPVLAGPFLTSVGAVLPRVWGRTGHLARENCRRDPRRTAATASALMIGLALVSAFTVLGSSTNASVDRLVTQGLRADAVVSTSVARPFTPEVAERLAAVEGVQGVMRLRYAAALLDGQVTDLVAVDAGTLDQTVGLVFLEGDAESLAGNGLIVDQPTAATRGWQVGDLVDVRLEGGGQLVLTVGGIYETNALVGPRLVSLDAFEAAGAAALDQFVYVDIASDADEGVVQAGLAAVVADYPVVSLLDQDAFAAEQKSTVDQVLLLLNAMLALSVLIAVLGIVNTLALAVIERTREIGLLRAVGTSRRQVRRMVRLESLVISLYGATVGLVLGTVLGVALSRALADQGITDVSVPVARLLPLVLVAGAIGVVASLWPARRAARLPVLGAIATA